MIKKSQRGGSVDVFVSRRVNLPHEYALSGQSKDQMEIRYGSLPQLWSYKTKLMTRIIYLRT